MRKKAIILDLDNTVYPVSAIADKLFKPLYALIEESGEYQGDLGDVKWQIMRRPFQWVAQDFNFSEQLREDCLKLLADLTYNEKMEPFDGYEHFQKLPQKKYLVTTGFSKMQHSKIRQLGIAKDFDDVIVVDPSKSGLTKKDIFRQIMQDHHYAAHEVLVVGDDPESELKAAKELGIDTVQYANPEEKPDVLEENTIGNFRELEPYLI